ncbi:MAG: GNAT family N-acetyltransferase [Azoarcus sp.]|jgi:GNAT superfamily N-acetyltransferase|nr:GNAT family N-acetyltransferase [Azoarcus sp.]
MDCHGASAPRNDEGFRLRSPQGIRAIALRWLLHDCCDKVPLLDFPIDIARKLPRYSTVPAIRMGRLAVDKAFKGKGLGGALLADALDRAARSEIATFALVVDAKDAQAAAFYQHYGFTAFRNLPLALFFPLASVRTM